MNFKELIRYTEVADNKFITIFEETQVSLPEAEGLFSHILNAQHIWISRICKVESKYERFQLHDKKEFKSLHLKNIADMYDLANTDLNFNVSYSNFQGDKLVNSLSDILFHMVNHSTYHRAQIATHFRINNIQPPITDYIYLKSKNQL